MNMVQHCLKLLSFLCLPLLGSPIYAYPSPSLPINNQQFYILKIEDHRSVKPRIRRPGSNPTATIQLPEGDFPAINTFLLANSNSSKKLRPVIISIKETSIIESSQDNHRIEGRVRVKLNFQLAKGGERVNLMDYDGESRYSRNISNISVPAIALNRTLESGLMYLDKWIEREAPGNIKLATGLQFHFADFEEQHEDTVYYSHNRPLQWSDFKDSPKANSFGAEVFAGFGFDQHTRIENGVIHVSIMTKVFVPKSASWVRADNRNNYALNHEQRHFDFAKIIAEQFKQQILTADLTIDNYEGFLGPHYLETLRSMNRMQEQYDRESRHGMDKSFQEVWNHKIDAELDKFELNK